jgi:hypothetical protein
MIIRPGSDEPVFLVICRKNDMYCQATSSFFVDRKDAEHYAETVAVSRGPIVLQLDGLMALVFRTFRELAMREIGREKNEKAKAEAKGPTDSPEQKVPLARTSG